jgi:hypothetical protein
MAGGGHSASSHKYAKTGNWLKYEEREFAQEDRVWH